MLLLLLLSLLFLGLQTLAKGVTPDSGGRGCRCPRSRLRSNLSYSGALYYDYDYDYYYYYHYHYHYYTERHSSLCPAIAETPVEPTFSPSTETEDDMTPQQSNDSKNQSPRMISTAPNEDKTNTVEKSDGRTTTGQSDDVNIEVASGSQDSLEEREDAMPK